MAGGNNKQLLYMDVRSLSTGKLLATWTLGALKPAENVPDLANPGMSEANKDKSRNGLTGQPRADFIKAAICWMPLEIRLGKFLFVLRHQCLGG